MFCNFRSNLSGIAVDRLFATEDSVKSAFQFCYFFNSAGKDITGCQCIRTAKSASADEVCLVCGNS